MEYQGLFCYDRGFKEGSKQHRMYLALLDQSARHEQSVYDDHRIKRKHYENGVRCDRKRFLELHVEFFKRLTDPLTGENFAMTVEEVATYYGVEMPQ